MSAISLERLTHRYHNDHELCAEIWRLSAENARYRKALSYYGDPDNWQEPDDICAFWTLWDNGANISTEIAREALKGD